jgi:hypothetical protein
MIRKNIIIQKRNPHLFSATRKSGVNRQLDIEAYCYLMLVSVIIGTYEFDIKNAMLKLVLVANRHITTKPCGIHDLHVLKTCLEIYCFSNF